MPTNELAYSTIEVQSYLPSGWSLEDPEGTYSGSQQCWQVEVQDVSEFIRTLEVTAKDAARLGRIPALRNAIDRLYRHA